MMGKEESVYDDFAQKNGHECPFFCANCRVDLSQADRARYRNHPFMAVETPNPCKKRKNVIPGTLIERDHNDREDREVLVRSRANESIRTSAVSGGGEWA